MSDHIDARRVRDFHLSLADDESLPLGPRLFAWLLADGGDDEQGRRRARIEGELARKLAWCKRETLGYRGVTFNLKPGGEAIETVVDYE